MEGLGVSLFWYLAMPGVILGLIPCLVRNWFQWFIVCVPGLLASGAFWIHQLLDGSATFVTLYVGMASPFFLASSLTRGLGLLRPVKALSMVYRLIVQIGAWCGLLLLEFLFVSFLFSSGYIQDIQQKLDSAKVPRKCVGQPIRVYIADQIILVPDSGFVSLDRISNAQGTRSSFTTYSFLNPTSRSQICNNTNNGETGARFAKISIGTFSDHLRTPSVLAKRCNHKPHLSTFQQACPNFEVLLQTLPRETNVFDAKLTAPRVLGNRPLLELSQEPVLSPASIPESNLQVGAYLVSGINEEMQDITAVCLASGENKLASCTSFHRASGSLYVSFVFDAATDSEANTLVTMDSAARKIAAELGVRYRDGPT